MGSGRTSARPLVGFLFVLQAGVLTSALAWSPSATAQEKTPQAGPAAKARAADLYQQSVDSYRKGDFRTTIAQLQEAYALDPQPVLLYNLARAYEGVGDIDSAIDAYTRYLKLDPKTRDRGAIEQRIATLQRERDERAALQKQSEIDRQNAKDQADRAAKEKAERDAKGTAERPAPPHHRSAWPYVVGGVGLAGLAAGSVFGLMAVSEHGTARNEPVQQTAANDQNRAQTLATVSTVTMIAGGAFLAVGATWWILDGSNTSNGNPKASRAAAGIAVVPGGVVLRGSFQ